MGRVVDYLVTAGKLGDEKGFTEACRAVGYRHQGGQEHSGIRVQAHRLRHNPRISEAILEEGRPRIGLALPGFLSTVIAIGTDPAHPHGLKAALAGLAMDGMSPVHRSESVVTHVDGDLMDRARAAAARLGIDLSQLEAPLPLVIEHEDGDGSQ